MAVIDEAAEDFVGFEDAERRLHARWERFGYRAQTAVVIVIGVAAQLAWLALFAYAVFRFV